MWQQWIIKAYVKWWDSDIYWRKLHIHLDLKIEKSYADLNAYVLLSLKKINNLLPDIYCNHSTPVFIIWSVGDLCSIYSSKWLFINCNLCSIRGVWIFIIWIFIFLCLNLHSFLFAVWNFNLLFYMFLYYLIFYLEWLFITL